jgi:hypothetical protein
MKLNLSKLAALVLMTILFGAAIAAQAQCGGGAKIEAVNIKVNRVKVGDICDNDNTNVPLIFFTNRSASESISEMSVIYPTANICFSCPDVCVITNELCVDYGYSRCCTNGYCWDPDKKIDGSSWDLDISGNGTPCWNTNFGYHEIRKSYSLSHCNSGMLTNYLYFYTSECYLGEKGCDSCFIFDKIYSTNMYPFDNFDIHTLYTNVLSNSCAPYETITEIAVRTGNYSWDYRKCITNIYYPHSYYGEYKTESLTGKVDSLISTYLPSDLSACTNGFASSAIAMKSLTGESNAVGIGSIYRINLGQTKQGVTNLIYVDITTQAAGATNTVTKKHVLIGTNVGNGDIMYFPTEHGQRLDNDSITWTLGCPGGVNSIEYANLEVVDMSSITAPAPGTGYMGSATEGGGCPSCSSVSVTPSLSS